MPIVNYDGIWDLVTPQGTLSLNDPNGADGFYALIVEACQGGPGPVRATKMNVPQGNGSILRRRFFPGWEQTLTVEPWQDADTPGCEAQVAVQMMDRLYRHLGSILEGGDLTGRLIFNPGEGQPTRLLDELQLLSLPYPALAAGQARQTFVLDSPFPYALDYTQSDDVIDTTSSTLTNTGSAPMLPVVKVFGPTTTFTITNSTTNQTFAYDGAQPGASSIGGGDYAEIDMFRGSIWLNGDVANLFAGIDMDVTEFWALQPGVNAVTTDCYAEFLWQAAWY